MTLREQGIEQRAHADRWGQRRLEVGRWLGMLISPRNTSRGSSHGLRQLGQLVGTDAGLGRAAIDIDLQAHLQGGRCDGRWSLRRCAMRNRSTDCTQSKCSATGASCCLHRTDAVPLEHAALEGDGSCHALLDVVLANRRWPA